MSEHLGSPTPSERATALSKARSPHRIKPFLRAVESIWEQNPDMRFGQLMMNLSREPFGFIDTWNWEDSTWYERFQRYSDLGFDHGAEQPPAAERTHV